MRTTLTEASRKRFLKAYAECGVIGEAARMAKIGRRTHYDWMAADPDYQRDFAAATEEAADRMEAELIDRVYNGTEETVVYQGEIQYRKDARGKLTKTPLTVRRKNDVLLMFALKSVRPEKYRDNYKAEIDLKAGVKADIHATHNVDFSRLSDEEFNEFVRLCRIIERPEEAGGSHIVRNDTATASSA